LITILVEALNGDSSPKLNNLVYKKGGDKKKDLVDEMLKRGDFSS